MARGRRGLQVRRRLDLVVVVAQHHDVAPLAPAGRPVSELHEDIVAKLVPRLPINNETMYLVLGSWGKTTRDAVRN